MTQGIVVVAVADSEDKKQRVNCCQLVWEVVITSQSLCSSDTSVLLEMIVYFTALVLLGTCTCY